MLHTDSAGLLLRWRPRPAPDGGLSHDSVPLHRTDSSSDVCPSAHAEPSPSLTSLSRDGGSSHLLRWPVPRDWVWRRPEMGHEWQCLPASPQACRGVTEGPLRPSLCSRAGRRCFSCWHYWAPGGHVCAALAGNGKTNESIAWPPSSPVLSCSGPRCLADVSRRHQCLLPVH